MDDTTFDDLLDRHGATLERWPDLERSEVVALLARSPRASSALAEMARVERALERRPSVDAAGVSTMAATASRHRQVSRGSRNLARAACGAATAAALVVGLLVGQLTFQSSDDGPDRLMAAALDMPAADDMSGAADVD